MNTYEMTEAAAKLLNVTIARRYDDTHDPDGQIPFGCVLVHEWNGGVVIPDHPDKIMERLLKIAHRTGHEL